MIERSISVKLVAVVGDVISTSLEECGWKKGMSEGWSEAASFHYL
jgi:hypothetical protein